MFLFLKYFLETLGLKFDKDKCITTNSNVVLSTESEQFAVKKIITIYFLREFC